MSDSQTVKKTKAEKLENLKEQLANREKTYADNLAKMVRRIEVITAKGNTQDRKDDTRRKILCGAMIEDRVKRRQLSNTKLTDWMDSYLVRDEDRLLFGLDVIAKSDAESQSVQINVDKYNIALSRLSTEIEHDKVSNVLAHILSKSIEEAQKITEEAMTATIFICEDVDHSTVTLVQRELESIGCQVEINTV